MTKQTQHRIAHLTIRMVCLSSWLYKIRPTVSLENIGELNEMLEAILINILDDSIEKTLSLVAREQLRMIAVNGINGIEETELDILSECDSYIDGVGPSPEDAVIIGLCLRRLALLYRLL